MKCTTSFVCYVQLDDYNELMTAAIHLAVQVNDINSTANIAGWDVQVGYTPGQALL